MKFEWDETKRAINLDKHGMDFSVAYRLWDFAMVISEDKRYYYGERRWVGLGLLEKRVMLVVFTTRPPDLIRLISFRKANRREVIHYEQATTS